MKYSNHLQGNYDFLPDLNRSLIITSTGNGTKNTTLCYLFSTVSQDLNYIHIFQLNVRFKIKYLTVRT